MELGCQRLSWVTVGEDLPEVLAAADEVGEASSFVVECF